MICLFLVFIDMFFYLLINHHKNTFSMIVRNIFPTLPCVSNYKVFTFLFKTSDIYDHWVFFIWWYDGNFYMTLLKKNIIASIWTFISRDLRQYFTNKCIICKCIFVDTLCCFICCWASLIIIFESLEIAFHHKKQHRLLLCCWVILVSSYKKIEWNVFAITLIVYSWTWWFDWTIDDFVVKFKCRINNKWSYNKDNISRNGKKKKEFLRKSKYKRQSEAWWLKVVLTN